uniref:Uncharacterized protein n=1 Tax=Rhizophora mucronata TaxID=61149 RepID=A0A2P2L1B1_RHIMU
MFIVTHAVGARRRGIFLGLQIFDLPLVIQRHRARRLCHNLLHRRHLGHNTRSELRFRCVVERRRCDVEKM